MAQLAELASQIRSKNAGPMHLTLDLFFDDRATYERVRRSNAITRASIAELYGIPEGDVVGIYEMDRVMAIKISLARPVAAGDLDDSDIYGTQQHTPLLELDV